MRTEMQFGNILSLHDAVVIHDSQFNRLKMYLAPCSWATFRVIRGRKRIAVTNRNTVELLGAIRIRSFEIGSAPGTNSMPNSISLAGGSPGSSSGSKNISDMHKTTGQDLRESQETLAPSEEISRPIRITQNVGGQWIPDPGSMKALWVLSLWGYRTPPQPPEGSQHHF
ncbi:hypothetical protein Tco_0538426 [Tanacetum coccineum]